MKICGRVAVIILKTILHILCKVDRKELKKIPPEGPYIIAFNHINFLEVPMIFVDLYPRQVSGVAKKETWDNKLLGFVADCWDTIAINRQSFTADTFRQIKESFKKNRFVVVAPEGTRTGSGIMKKAHPGVIAMAQQSDIPIIPVVHFGGEKFWDNLFKFKRTRFTYRVGEPLKVLLQERNRQARQKTVDQLMLRMAKLLPQEYRGYYSEVGKINDEFLREIDYIK
jgi:1-acyl-sn-glycerol-3-phosphate acyltransferase